MTSSATSPLGPGVQWAVENVPRLVDEYLPEPVKKFFTGGYFNDWADRLKKVEEFKVNASSQFAYYSTQLLKLDTSMATFAYDAIKWDESGFSIAGVTVYKPKYIDRMENFLAERTNGRLGEASISPRDVQMKLDSLETRVAQRITDEVHPLKERIRDNDRRLDTAEDTLKTHRRHLEQLARGQQRTAAAGASNYADQARRRDRAGTLNPMRTQVHRAAAAELRQLEAQLQRTTREADALARELAGSGS